MDGVRACHLSDEKLAARVVRGEAGADDALAARHREFVLGLASRWVGPDVADDVLIRVIEILWRNNKKALREWRGSGELSAYLGTITRRVCTREFRHRGVFTVGGRPVLSVVVEALDGWIAHDAAGLTLAEDPSSVVEKAELCGTVMGALEELPERDRLIVRQRFLGGLNAREIADRMEMSHGAVRQALFVALRHLKGLLAVGLAEPHV